VRSLSSSNFSFGCFSLMLFRLRYLGKFGGHDFVQLKVMREVVHKRQNGIAIEQQALAGAAVGDVGELVGRDVQLLGEDLPVAVSLIEHIHKVAVLEDVRDFGAGQQILAILGQARGNPAPFAETLPDFDAIGCGLLFF